MRRFSQRSHLVTLSEINITPLLDLAFVLLIIFVITAPLMEKGLELRLPPASGQPGRTPDKRDIRTVEINQQGQYFVDRRPVALAALLPKLIQDFRGNPNLVINIRADRKSAMEYFVALTDACRRNGITRFSIATELTDNR